MFDIVTRSTDARALAAARILVGLASLPFAVEWFLPLQKVAAGTHVVVPIIVPMPAWLPIPLLAVALIAGITMTLGLASRLSSAAVAASAAVALLADQQTWSNHLLLLSILAALIAVSGSGQAWTLLNRTRSAQVPYWPAFLIKVQITSLYAWTAVAKINPDYLSGDVIEVHLRSWVPIPDSLLPMVAVGSIAAEAFLAVALWIRVLQPLAFLVGFGLHIGILLTIRDAAPLVPFAALMLAGYVQFWWDSRRARHRRPVRFSRVRLSSEHEAGNPAG